MYNTVPILKYYDRGTIDLYRYKIDYSFILTLYWIIPHEHTSGSRENPTLLMFLVLNNK